MKTTSLITAFKAVWAALHVMQYGLAITSLNGIQDAVTCSMKPVSTPSWLVPCIPMSPSEFGIVVSIFTLGGLLGSLSSDLVTRKVGRIWVFRVSASVILVGSSVVGLSNSVLPMILGRVLVGTGCGLATVSVSVYLSEIAPASIKRSLGIMNQLFIVIGMLIGQSLSFLFAQPTTWRWVFAFSTGFAVLQLCLSVLIPEPTKDRSEVNRNEEAPLLSNNESAPLSIKGLFTSTDPKIRRGLIVVIVTQISQQICGVSPVMYFSTRILQPVFGGNSRLLALSLVIFKIPLTVIPAFIIERLGSRPILLFSSFIMTFAALLLAIGLDTDSRSASAIAILTFVASFSVGLGAVTWVVIGEIMPKHATTAAGAIGISLNWTMSFIMGASFLPLQEFLSRGEDSGEGNIFFLLSCTCTLAFIATHTSYAALSRVA